MDSMNKSPAEEVEKTGIDQRYPIDAEEYHDWVARYEIMFRPCSCMRPESYMGQSHPQVFY